MLKLFRERTDGVRIDKPFGLTEDQEDVLSYVVSSMCFLLPVGKWVSGMELGVIINQYSESPRSRAVAKEIMLIDALPPHYLFEVSEDVYDDASSYKPEFHRIKNKLFDRAFSLFSQRNQKGYPFSFVTGDGKNAIGLVFGHTESDAYVQVSHFDGFQKPSDYLNMQNVFISSAMDRRTMWLITQEAFSVLPSINHYTRKKTNAA